jgi:hypothetical protein
MGHHELYWLEEEFNRKEEHVGPSCHQRRVLECELGQNELVGNYFLLKEEGYRPWRRLLRRLMPPYEPFLRIL